MKTFLTCKSLLTLMVFSLTLSMMLTLTSTVSAQSKRPNAVDLLPDRTAVYLRVDNVKELVEDLKESNFGKMLRDEKIAPLVEELYGEAKKAFDEFDAEEGLGFSLSEIASLPAGEVCFAVVTPRRSEPRFVLIMDVPDDSDIAQRLIDRAVEEAEEDEDTEFDSGAVGDIEYQIIRGNSEDEHVHYVLHENTLVAANDPDLFEEVMTRWVGAPPAREKTLADNRKFITIMNKCNSTADLPMSVSFFIDPIMLARSITTNQAGAKLAFAALPTLGLDGVSALGASALFNERDYESVFHGHLLLTNPRAGIINMLAMRPGYYEPESFVPADTVTYATSSWEFQTFMTELENIVDTFTSEGTFQQTIDENINEELGINFQKDVMANLAGRVSYLQWIGDNPTIDGQCNAMVIQVEDPDAAREFIESMLDRIGEDSGEDNIPIEETYKGIDYWASPISMEERRREFRREWRERRRENDERDFFPEEDEDRTRMDVVETVPCFCFIEDSLVFAGNVDMLKHLIETHDGDHDMLVRDREFKSTMDEIRGLTDGNLPSMVSYTRPAETLKMFYELLESENTKDVLYERAEENPIYGILNKLVEENELPPFDDVAKYFPPQGSFMINDETGFHLLAFQRRADVEEDEDK